MIAHRPTVVKEALLCGDLREILSQLRLISSTYRMFRNSAKILPVE